MNRRLISWVLFTLCLCGMASAQTPGPDSRGALHTPAWLPRAAFLGTSLEGGAIVPQVRLQWQLLFYEARRDSLGLFIEPLAARPCSPLVPRGGPVRTVPPGTFTRLSLYSLVMSLGYTNRQESGLEWGFQVGTGPAWYEARFQGSSKAQESYWVGLLDGRLRLGYHPGPVSFGVSVGYSSPYNYKRSSLAHAYVGGLQLGLYADWR